MEFTLKEYDRLLKTLKNNNYKFVGYREADNSKSEKVCILRHDIDMSVEKALKLSEIEKKNGIKSTYFVLLRTGFYNVFSNKTKEMLMKIIDNGCDIGLHFDEVQYNISGNLSNEEYESYIIKSVKEECELLSCALGITIDMVSMHRPSKKILEEKLDFGNILNSYSEKYFSEYKYLSDSRRHWRENVFEHIEKGTKKLHILTHPIWYAEGDEEDMKKTLVDFCDEAKMDRYQCLEENITNLDSVLTEEDL